MRHSYNTLSNAARILKDVVLPKSLYLAYVKMRRVLVAVEKDRDEVVKKLHDDFGQEMDNVINMRNQGAPITGHEAYLKAEREANVVLGELFNEEHHVDFGDIDENTLVDDLLSTGLKADEAAYVQEIILG